MSDMCDMCDTICHMRDGWMPMRGGRILSHAGLRSCMGQYSTAWECMGVHGWDCAIV